MSEGGAGEAHAIAAALAGHETGESAEAAEDELGGEGKIVASA
jgi:hypothetical protein